MYSLENNVQWTTDLKNAFKHNITRAKIVYNNTEINYDNGLKEIEIEDNRYVPNLGFIGQATSRKATIVLLDNELATNLENAEFEIYIGADYNNQTYYINYGKFIVDTAPENDMTNGTIKLTAYDYMIKFNKEYEDTIIYPCTLKALLLNVCYQAGVTLGTNAFANQDFSVENNQFQGKTLRDVLQNIAKCAFSWARIGQDNKLYLDFEVSDVVTETLDIDDYYQDGYKKANEYYGAINKVTYGDSNITGQEESVQDTGDIVLHGTKELIIKDNYFAYTTAKRRALIQAGTRLFGLKYMPIQELKTIGLIYLDCNDIIEIEDEEENSITTRNFNHTISYNGATQDSIQTEGISNNEKTYENKNAPAVKNSTTEIIVDRANKKIESINSEIGDRTEKTTTITQDLDRIESKVDMSVDFLATVEGRGELETEEAMPYETYEIEIQGYKEYNNYLYSGDTYSGDSYSNGGNL